jgi:hypothetical protein
VFPKQDESARRFGYAYVSSGFGAFLSLWESKPKIPRFFGVLATGDFSLILRCISDIFVVVPLSTDSSMSEMRLG